MMHYQSHRGRYMDNPLAAPKRKPWYTRMLDAIREAFTFYELPEGRRAIIPGNAPDNHGLGYYPPCYPQAKEKAR